MQTFNQPLRIIASEDIRAEHFLKHNIKSTKTLKVEVLETPKVVKKLTFKRNNASDQTAVHFKEETVHHHEVNTEAFELIASNNAHAFLLPFENLGHTLPDQMEIMALLAPLKDEEANAKEIKIIAGQQPPHWNGYLILVGLPKNRQNIDTLFGHLDVRKKWGEVVIAGFGPGNPDLLTIKALKAIEKSDVIFHDNLLDINFLNTFDAEKIYVGKRSKNHAFTQDLINEKLRLAAIQGKNVVRLKGGDPFIFGRGIEEVDYLTKNFIKTTVIPGISSAQAASVDALAPLTARFISSSVAWLSAHDVAKLKIPQADTLVFFMGASQQELLAKRLLAEGWKAETPVAVVQNASYSYKEVRRYTLGSMASSIDKLPSPVVIIVGWTAEKERSKLPKKWMNTGALHSSLDAMDIHAPLVRIKSLNRTLQQQNIFNKLNEFEQIVLCDPHAVESFFDILKETNRDIRSLSRLKIIALGRGTAKELKKTGVNADGTYETIYDTIKTLRPQNIFSNNTLVVSDERDKEEMQNQFKGVGVANVTFLALHESVATENPVVHDLKEFNGVAFSHPLEIERFENIYKNFPSHLKFRCTNSMTKNYLTEMRNSLNKNTLLKANS